MACNCTDCKGSVVNLLEFEEHSGSWDRYRTGNMILSKFNISLKVRPTPSYPNLLKEGICTLQPGFWI